jgi:hypothetical protein
MDLNLIATAAAVIATGYLTVQILSGKKLEDFLYSNEYSNFTQYFFRPKSLILSLLFGSTTAISTYIAIKSGSLNGNELIFSFGAFLSTVFMLLVYNCWSGSVTRRLSILLLAVGLTTIYWLVSFNTNGVDLRENISTLTSLSLFTGCVFALWLRAD